MSEDPVSKNKNQMSCASCFKSIGVPSRMEIYTFLHNVENATVSDIVDQLDLTQPTVSYHLKEMKGHGLLSSKRKGKQVYYFIDHSCPHSSENCVLSKINFIERTNE